MELKALQVRMNGRQFASGLSSIDLNFASNILRSNL